MLAPVPLGDVVDRVTILRLKVARLDGIGRVRARDHLAALETTWREAGLPALDTLDETAGLIEINTRLWEVEDALRQHEAREDFGAAFVALARSVYQLNDRRAALKAAVDARLGSAWHDPKSHP